MYFINAHECKASLNRTARVVMVASSAAENENECLSIQASIRGPVLGNISSSSSTEYWTATPRACHQIKLTAGLTIPDRRLCSNRNTSVTTKESAFISRMTRLLPQTWDRGVRTTSWEFYQPYVASTTYCTVDAYESCPHKNMLYEQKRPLRVFSLLGPLELMVADILNSFWRKEKTPTSSWLRASILIRHAR